MERQALYERFKSLDWQHQLGNLASTLAILSTQSIIPEQDKLTGYLMREAVLMIEWCAANVPENFMLELAAMQRELLAWKRVFPLEEVRNLLALHTRNQSDRLLEMAELLPDEDLSADSNQPTYLTP